MAGKDVILSEEELDGLLDAAGVPEIPWGAEQRLMVRVASESLNNVVPFPQRAKPAPAGVWRWQMPAALAASLMLGIWLGTQGPVSNAVAAATESAMLGSDSDFGPAGIDEIGSFDADNAT